MKTRIRLLREAKDLTQAQVADLLGMHITNYNKLERGRSKPDIGRFEKLAAILETSTADLFGSDAEPPSQEIIPSRVPIDMAPIVGITEAGSFRVVEDFDQDEPELYPVPKDTRFPNARVMVFEVSGDSMNALDILPLRAGALAVCVAYEDVAHKFPMRDGIVVVVERRRDGGHLREWSIKQVALQDDHVEFWPRSTNPAHKPIIVPRDSLADDGAEVEVIALVRSVIFRAPDF